MPQATRRHCAVRSVYEGIRCMQFYWLRRDIFHRPNGESWLSSEFLLLSRRMPENILTRRLNVPYICPVCAYTDLPEPPQNFSICPSCGTEFGFDDAKVSHAQLRRRWVIADAPWYSTVRHHPADWNPWMQLIQGHYGRDIPFSGEIRSRYVDTVSAKAILTPQMYTVQFT